MTVGRICKKCGTVTSASALSCRKCKGKTVAELGGKRRYVDRSTGRRIDDRTESTSVRTSSGGLPGFGRRS